MYYFVRPCGKFVANRVVGGKVYTRLHVRLFLLCVRKHVETESNVSTYYTQRTPFRSRSS